MFDTFKILVSLMVCACIHTKAQELAIELDAEGGVQLLAKAEQAKGFQLESSTNGFDWVSSSDHWTGNKIFPLKTVSKQLTLYRLKIWEFAWDPIRLVIIGDSTIANFNVVFGNSGGWGQALPEWFGPDITIANQAQPGISTKIFLNTPIFLHNLLTAKPDFVLLHFGYMDARSQRDHIRTTPEEFVENITSIVGEIRKIGGTPILCTPVSATAFNGSNLRPILSEHSEQIRQLATELECFLIDVHEVSFKLFQELGPEGTLPYQGAEDDQLHFNEAGAKVIASLAAPLFPPFLKAYQVKPAHAP